MRLEFWKLELKNVCCLMLLSSNSSQCVARFAIWGFDNDAVMTVKGWILEHSILGIYNITHWRCEPHAAYLYTLHRLHFPASRQP